MTENLTGGCQCGQVRYEITAAPLTFYICHCTECQKQSASAFGMSLTVRQDATRISGRMKSWARPAESGSNLTCHFCPICGTRLFHARDGAGEVWNVKAGSLDEAHKLTPIGHIWTRSALPWVHIPEDTLNYEAQPPAKNALNDAWEKQQTGD